VRIVLSFSLNTNTLHAVAPTLPSPAFVAELQEPIRRAKAPKQPPKEFRMPDNVRTGVVNAFRLGAKASEEDTSPISISSPRASEPSHMPLLSSMRYYTARPAGDRP